MTEQEKLVTYFAIDPHDPTGQALVLGRGNPDDPDSLASEAFASVDTTNATFATAVTESINVAAEGEPITRENAAQVLGRAFQLARDSVETEHDPEVELRSRVSTFRDTCSDDQVKAVLEVILPDLETAEAQYLLGIASLVMKPKRVEDLKDLFVIFIPNGDIRLSLPTNPDGGFEDYSLKPDGIFRNGFDQGEPVQEPVDEAGTQSLIEHLAPYTA
jgi:hypothetical protein